MTCHFTLLAFDAADGHLIQTRRLTLPKGQSLIDLDPPSRNHVGNLSADAILRPIPLRHGPLIGYDFVQSAEDPSVFHLINGRYLCAPPNLGRVINDRDVALQWETFRFVTSDEAATYLQIHESAMIRPLLRELASEIIMLEEIPKCDDKPTYDFAKLMSNQHLNPCQNWVPRPHTIRNYRVARAVLDGRFRGLFVDSKFVGDSSYLTPEQEIDELHLDGRNAIVYPDVHGPAIVGSNVATNNYYHWITQGLPAIDVALRRDGQDRNACIIVPKLTTWQEESLSLLGYDRIGKFVIEDPLQKYYLPEVEFSDIITGATSFSCSPLVKSTYRRLRESVNKPQHAGRKLYIARSDAPHRKMRNEPAVIEGLMLRGFEVVEAGKMTFSEQIATFRSADLIVGPHGAGLTNIAFCEPNTFVYEIMPAGYANTCFCNLAAVCELQYWADCFESDGPDHVPPFLRDWESDTSKVLERVDEIMREVRRRQDLTKTMPISAVDYLLGKPGVPDVYRTPATPATQQSRPTQWLSRLWSWWRSPRPP